MYELKSALRAFSILIIFIFPNLLVASTDVDPEQIENLVNVISNITKNQQSCGHDKIYLNIQQTPIPNNGNIDIKDCPELKEKFKNHMESTLSKSIADLNVAQQCISNKECPDGVPDNKKLQSDINRYRNLQKNLHKYALREWLSKKPDLVKNCFLSNYKLSLSDNIRVPKLSNNSPFCQNQSRAWSQNISSQLLALENSKLPFSIEESSFFSSYKNSISGRLIPVNKLYNQKLPLTELEARKVQFNINKSVLKSLEKLKDNVEDLEENETYQLYGFNNELVSFLESRSLDDQELALKCQKKSGFVHDCIKTRNKNCSSRLWELGKDTLPVISFFDALEQSKDLLAIEHLGLMSKDDLINKKSTLILQGMLSVTTSASIGKGIAKSVVSRKSLQSLASKVSSPQLASLSNIQQSFNLSTAQVRKIVNKSKNLDATIAQLEKVSKNQPLNVDEAIDLGKVLFKSNVRQVLTTHSTKFENLNGILSSGLSSSHPTKKNFAIAIPTNRSTVAKYLAGGKYGDSTLFFQGEAAKLFKPHKNTGIATYTKKLQRIETSDRGTIDIISYKRVGKDIIVTDAKLRPNTTPISANEIKFWALTDGVSSIIPVASIGVTVGAKKAIESRLNEEEE